MPDPSVIESVALGGALGVALVLLAILAGRLVPMPAMPAPLAVMRACVVCGAPSDGSRCPEHAGEVAKGSPRSRGYDAAWDRLSLRARKLQPFCSDCGSQRDLQCDHKPEAWERKAAGLPIRLQDVDVVCAPCNVRRGAARGPLTRGDGVAGSPAGPRPQPELPSLSHSPNGRVVSGAEGRPQG